MKKTLLHAASLAALAAMATSATAAGVELYGVLDYGISVRHREYADGTDSTQSRMVSGQYIGSRVGLKGEEDLGNGLKVGFVLENGFSTDSGALGQGGRLFGRDARLY